MKKYPIRTKINDTSSLTDIEIKKIDEIKDRVLKGIISRPKGTINIEKTWIIDDSEFNDISNIEKSNTRKIFLQKNKIKRVIKRRYITITSSSSLISKKLKRA